MSLNFAFSPMSLMSSALPSGAAPARVRPGKAPAGDEILRPLEHDAHPLQLVEAEGRQPPGVPDAAVRDY